MSSREQGNTECSNRQYRGSLNLVVKISLGIPKDRFDSGPAASEWWFVEYGPERLSGLADRESNGGVANALFGKSSPVQGDVSVEFLDPTEQLKNHRTVPTDSARNAWMLTNTEIVFSR